MHNKLESYSTRVDINKICWNVMTILFAAMNQFMTERTQYSGVEQQLCSEKREICQNRKSGLSWTIVALCLETCLPLRGTTVFVGLLIPGF